MFIEINADVVETMGGSLLLVKAWIRAVFLHHRFVTITALRVVDK